MKSTVLGGSDEEHLVSAMLGLEQLDTASNYDVLDLPLFEPSRLKKIAWTFKRGHSGKELESVYVRCDHGKSAFFHSKRCWPYANIGPHGKCVPAAKQHKAHCSLDHSKEIRRDTTDRSHRLPSALVHAHQIHGLTGSG